MNTEDRRAPGVARINFDGLVEVGGSLGPSFEAHALDVSEEGMHLRTAYLPELGQQVTCRFEAGAGESVVGSGEVMWCRAADKGGEFGVRFTEMDAECVESLKRVCGFGGGAGSAQPGGKVRLYIEGLASPMRAKVRDARATAITVGSDLGFLQVGKHLELEDTVSGSKRPASIDRVDVAVDPESHVPQLIVTLRYADVGAADAGRTEPPSEARAGRAAPPMFDDPPANMTDLADMGEMGEMKGMLATQAARIGPAFERLGHRVKTTIALLAKRGRAEDDAMPRRTTAPAPGGGLHASGRRVVRAEANGATDGGQPAAKPSAPSARRRAAIATAVMATAVLGAVAIKRVHHEPASTSTSSTNAPAASDTGAPAAAAPAASAGPSADTSAVAAIAPPAAAASQASAATPAPAAPPVAATPGDRIAPTTAAATAEDGTSAAHKTHARPAPFANGPVHHGNVLRLHMDGPVEVLEGAQQPTGFTVKLPGRRSLEAAAPLAARDARIATIKVNNEPSGAELTVVFKDGVPNYRVSARGDSLVIALAPIGALEATTAKRDPRDERAAKTSKHTSRMRDATPER